MLLLVMHFMIKILVEGVIERLSLHVWLLRFRLNCFSNVELALGSMWRLTTAIVLNLLFQHNKIIPAGVRYIISRSPLLHQVGDLLLDICQRPMQVFVLHHEFLALR